VFLCCIYDTLGPSWLVNIPPSTDTRVLYWTKILKQTYATIQSLLVNLGLKNQFSFQLFKRDFLVETVSNSDPNKNRVGSKYVTEE